MYMDKARRARMTARLHKRGGVASLKDFHHTLQDILGIFSGSFNFPGILRFFARKLRKDLGVNSLLVYLYAKDSQEIDLVGWQGIDERHLLALKSFSVKASNDILCRTIHKKSVQIDSAPYISVSLKHVAPLAVVAIPVLFQKEVLGCLVLLKRKKYERFLLNKDLFKLYYYILSFGFMLFRFLEKKDIDNFQHTERSKFEGDLEKLKIYQRIISSMIKEFGFLKFMVNPLVAMRKKIESEELLSILDGIDDILMDSLKRVKEIQRFTSIKLEESLSPNMLQVFDPTEIIQNHARERFSKQKDIQVHLNVEPGHFIQANRQEVGKALREIIDNAVQFTAMHGDMWISTYSDNTYLSVSITNTAEVDAARIEDDYLEPFRSSSTWSLGLGFSIAFALIARNKGKMLFFAHEPHLFTTRLVFPIYKEEKKHPGARKKILLVDDDKIFREMMLEIFEDRGYDVTTLVNAASALKELLENRYDLLICDIKLPQKDAWWLIREMSRLKEEQGFQTPPIVLTSGYIEQLDRERMQRHGIQYYLTKPFRYVDIINLLNRLL